MPDLPLSILIGLLGVVPLMFVVSRYRRAEVGLLFFSYFAHFIGPYAQVFITKYAYGSGDIFGYTERGRILAAAMRLSFSSVTPEVVKLLFHQEDVMLPVVMSGVGSSTASMSAIAGFICFFTGASVYSACMIIGIATFFGKLGIYQAFRESTAATLHSKLVFAVMLIPSVVFWSSGLLKEAVATIGLGALVLGMHEILKGKRARGLLLLIFGAVVVGLVKAYILFAFSLAAGVWIYAHRAVRDSGVVTLRFGHLLLGAVVGVGGVLGLGALFPQYALENVAEQAAMQQEAGQLARGSSTYDLGDPSERGLTGQLAMAPLALISALFRPFLFEVSNAQMAANALETATLLVMFVMAVWPSRFRQLWQTLTTSPIALFSVAFTLIFGVAVGLGTTNLGSLSRYRMPLLPFFAAFLFMALAEPAKTAVQRITASVRPRPSTRPLAVRPRQGA